MMALVASAAPMESTVNGLPVGASTVAPAVRQRSASGMSLVTTTLATSARSAIQSSAASKPSSTTTRAISGWSGTRSRLFATTVTAARWRSATR